MAKFKDIVYNKGNQAGALYVQDTKALVTNTNIYGNMSYNGKHVWRYIFFDAMMDSA